MATFDIREYIRSRLNPSSRLQIDIQRMYKARDRGLAVAAKLIHNTIIYRYGCCIGIHSNIAPSAVFPHPIGIVIGEGASVGSNCVIYQNVTLGQKNKGNDLYPRLGCGCTVYAGATILGNTILSDNSVVGAGAVVIDTHGKVGELFVGMPAKAVER